MSAMTTRQTLMAIRRKPESAGWYLTQGGTIAALEIFLKENPNRAAEIAQQFMKYHEYDYEFFWVLEIVKQCPSQVALIAEAIPRFCFDRSFGEKVESTRKIVAEYPEHAMTIAKALPEKVRPIVEELPSLALELAVAIPEQASTIVEVHPSSIIEICQALPKKFDELLPVFARHGRSDAGIAKALLDLFPDRARDIVGALAS